VWLIALSRASALDGSGRLAGEVRDATEAVVRSAQVICGEFLFGNLPPARYSITVTTEGMSQAYSQPDAEPIWSCRQL
jgi:hypothetical protein